MTLGEIREKKAATEKAIRDLLIDFTNTTGLVVEDIRFEMISAQMMGGNSKASCTSVELEVKI